MANPQTEDGFTKIANKLLEAIIFINLSGHEYKLLLFIIRQTYGYNKKTAKIPNSKMRKYSGLSKSRVSQIINKLEKSNIIIVENFQSGKTKEYFLNKDYDTWKGYHKNDTVHYSDTVHKSETKSITKMKHGYHISETTTNEPKYNSKEINKDISFLPKEFDCKNFKESFSEFRQHRKELKSTMTNGAEKLLIKKLQKLSDGNPKIAIQIIEKSILNGWKGIFELKKQSKSRQQKKGFMV